MDDVDRSQPWQTQHAERLSRSINSGSPWVKRQVRLFLAFLGLIVLAVVLLFFATLAWHHVVG